MKTHEAHLRTRGPVLCSSYRYRQTDIVLLLLLLLFLHKCICLLVVLMQGHMWRLEDNFWELVFSFCLVGPRA